jgi:homoserine O-acetyltransferase/O-succinyltransferase
MRNLRAALLAALLLSSVKAMAADYPAPKQGDWIAKNFRFHTGEVMPELKLHYTTLGEPTGQPVLVLHGSGGSAATMLTPTFAGELFGSGQPLDATKYYKRALDLWARTRRRLCDGLRPEGRGARLRHSLRTSLSFSRARH